MRYADDLQPFASLRGLLRTVFLGTGFPVSFPTAWRAIHVQHLFAGGYRSNPEWTNAQSAYLKARHHLAYEDIVT